MAGALTGGATMRRQRMAEEPPMRVKLFTLRFNPTLGTFDETPLQEFECDSRAFLHGVLVATPVFAGEKLVTPPSIHLSCGPVHGHE